MNTSMSHAVELSTGHPMDLSMEALDTQEAPLWEYIAGFGAGLAVGVGVGILIT